MSHPSRGEDDYVGLGVRVEPARCWQAREHYCCEAHGFIGSRVEGAAAGRDVFCPLCGAPVSGEAQRDRYDAEVRPDDYNGPHCPHGLPAASCIDLVSRSLHARWSIVASRSSIPEFAAAESESRYGCASTLVDWVRPCVRCRTETLWAVSPAICHELLEVSRRLRDESRKAEAHAFALRDETARFTEAARVIEQRINDLSPTSTDAPRGYVYLIGHERALKIGWSEKHPDDGRLASLQAGSCETLILEGLILGTQAYERELHARFADHRLRGEWFLRSEEIVHYFRKHGLQV
jgi:hypothetical protein